MINLNHLANCIDRSIPVPLYYQLKQRLEENIESGLWLPKEKLPSEAEFCNYLNLSRNTVRRVFQDLSHEGFIEKLQGKGTFVRKPSISHKFVTVVSFTEELMARGMRPTSELIGFEEKSADKEVAHKLHIKTGDPVYYIERLRFGDGKLLGYNLSRVPVQLCPDFTTDKLEKGSLYSLIEREFGHIVVKSERTLETLPVEKEIADLIKLKEGFPVLKISGIVYNQNQKPFDYCLEYYKS